MGIRKNFDCKRKKKKGFTLIELLAVIIIIAVIAVITIPIILNVVEASEKGALKATAQGIIKAGELLLTNEIETNSKLEIDDLATDETLKYKGTKPDKGYLNIYNNEQSEIMIIYKKWCAIKELDENEITIKTSIECEKLLNICKSRGVPNSPNLHSNMIPIKYDGTKWIKADITNNNNNWYNYDEQMWANAVTVKETSGIKTREYYKSAVIGTEIFEDDILTYMVWIPRYSYSISSESSGKGNGHESEICIKFEKTTDMKKNGTALDTSVYTHPAFTFGNKEIPGFWVGKFETTGNFESCNNINCNINNITIKPNISSIKNKNVSNFYFASRSMSANINNPYGYIDDNKTNIHMLKNSEWGAVSYLTQSKYGRCKFGICEEITINNNEDSKTGCAANFVSEASSSECNKYDTPKGTKSSTTGNIYGVYDMSGGAWEYVMSTLNDQIQNSGFDSLPELKYYDKYLFGLNDGMKKACDNKICKGHGLSETANWYNDRVHFIHELEISSGLTHLWLLRGGFSGYQDQSGIFSIGADTGYAWIIYSFRISHI